MITVSIKINGNTIYARTAVNISKVIKDSTTCKYRNDDGTIIKHDQKDGAIVLAKKMLDTIKELENGKTN